MNLIAQRYRSADAVTPADLTQRNGAAGPADTLLCEDTVTGRQVHVKIAKTSAKRGQQAKFDDAIRSETDVLNRCHHHNVIRLMGSGDWTGRPFLVLERLCGRKFREQMTTGQAPLEGSAIQRRVGWLAQAADALAAVHSAGFAHRSVGPDQFSIEPDGRVVLCGLERASTVGQADDVLAFGEMARDLFGNQAPAELASLIQDCANPNPAARPTASTLTEAFRNRLEKHRRKNDVRARAAADLQQNRPLDAVARWEEVMQDDPSDPEPAVESAAILLPLFEDAVRRYDFPQASEYESRIDLSMATPEQRETHRRLFLAQNEAQARDRVIDHHVRMAGVFRSEGRAAEEQLQLDRALAVDSSHPALRLYLQSMPRPVVAPVAAEVVEPAAAAPALATTEPVAAAAPTEESAPLVIQEPVSHAMLFGTPRPRRSFVPLLVGGLAVIAALAGLGFWWSDRESKRNLRETRDYSSVAYNDPTFQDCMGVKKCEDRKSYAAKLASVQNWASQPYDSPLFSDCMAYGPCLAAASDAKALQALNYREVTRTDPRRVRCRGWKPCLEIFPWWPPAPAVAEAATAVAPVRKPAVPDDPESLFSTRIPDRVKGSDVSPAPSGSDKIYQIKKQ